MKLIIALWALAMCSHLLAASAEVKRAYGYRRLFTDEQLRRLLK